ncbi:hypothetical protein [Bradyrhizobium sp. 18]|uniref:hypothetical protein n=1 Tax=Bradyrhizobium sp. 18 TaxID=2782657 RepID=UPI001FF8A065|nr:hypothetical protein [Bradyrhizobium sp. 18]MCK1507562.1 hypothetical protein [Bradyrhizobium sp. 18]
MDEQMKAFLDAIEGLRSDISASVDAISKRCDSLEKTINEKRSDTAGERDRGVDGTMAERVAADSVGATEFSVLCREVADLRKKVARPQADLNAFADVQAKADAVMRTHNERAEPPMAGEDIVAYKIRQHRGMQKFSPKWKGVELGIIAADGKAFENVLAEIRADAMQAGLNPVGLPEFQHREITRQMPGGHLVKSWVGTGTIFKQLSRPVRHVGFIGVRTGTGQ